METRRASITVFFSLIFLLILSLVGTMIDVARYQVSQNHTWRTLDSASAALFTEYNRPFYDEYNLFYIEDTGTPFDQVIASYMNDTLNPSDKPSFSLLNGNLLDVKVINKQYVGDDGGAALTDEITRFMQRKLAADAFSNFMSGTKQISSLESKAQSLTQEVEEEKEAAELDVNTLKLMELIDGVIVSDGEVSSADSFVKMVTPGEKSGAAVGISHPVAWQTVSSQVSTLEEWMGSETKCREITNQLQEVTEEAITLAQETQSELEKVSQPTESLVDYYDRMKDMFVGNAEVPGMVALLQSNKQILDQVTTLLDSGWSTENREEMARLMKSYRVSEIQFNYEGLTEEGGEDDPKDMVGDLLGDGLLKLVAKNPDKISHKNVSQADQYGLLYKDNSVEQEDYSGRLADFPSDDVVDFSGVLGDMAGYAKGEFCVDRYIDSFFGSVSQTVGNMKKALRYEQEYIICGDDSDEDNLSQIAKRLLLLRSTANVGTILADSTKRQQAYGVAVGIVGFTGMEPLIRLTQTLVMVAWSVMEGLVDVAALFQGTKVPVVKSSSQILVSVTELLSVNRSFIQNKAKLVKENQASLSYENYLLLFMVAMKASTKRYRMMDLMEWNMQKNYVKDFHLGTCVYAMDATSTVQYRSMFLRMPVVERMVGRSLRQFQHVTKVHYEY